MQATVSPAQAIEQGLGYRLAIFIGYVMQTCGRDVLQLATENEISFSQMKALHALREHQEPMPVNAVADRLGISLAAMSRAADGLVQRGLVDRLEDPEDRRIKRLSLTPAGDELVRKLIQSRLAGIEGFVDSLSAKEQALLEKALGPILERSEIAAFADRNSQ